MFAAAASSKISQMQGHAALVWDAISIPAGMIWKQGSIEKLNLTALGNLVNRRRTLHTGSI